MKAALVTGLEQVSIQDIPKPAINDDEVLIKTKMVGVCGSDLHLFKGTHAFRKPPAILGHEITGDIIEVGKTVKNLKIGDRVTVEPQYACGECEFCRDGLINLCNSKVVPGTPKWIGVFAEYFNAPAKTVYKLADKVDYKMGTMIEPLAVAIRALRKVTVKEKDTMVILGSGTIGLLILIAAKKMGYKNVICTDTADFNLQMAQKHGASITINPKTENVEEIVKKATDGRGADIAFIVAGAPNILDQATACVRKRGEIGIVAMITENIPFYSYRIVFNEQTMFGAMTYATRDFKEAVDMVNNGLDLSDLVTQTMDLEHTQEGLDVLSRKQENVVKVMIEI